MRVAMPLGFGLLCLVAAIRQEDESLQKELSEDKSLETELSEAHGDTAETLEIEANQSAPFSAEMLKKAQALIQKHTPKAVSEILTEDKLTSLLEHHGEVRAALSTIDPEFTLREHKEMKHLYKRAIGALDKSTVALLEESTRGKTPCVLMLEEYGGTELVDLDKIGDLGSKRTCNYRCLSGCKRASKFNINRDELRILGQNPDAPGLDGNQIGGQCEYDGDCKCLDATQSCRKIERVAERFGRFDVSTVYHTYEDEGDCMNSCPVKINQGGAEWRGMCFDEAPHTFYDDGNYGW